ncbi:hypothetical protein FQZ97_646860 [compost metagenome]
MVGGDAHRGPAGSVEASNRRAAGGSQHPAAGLFHRQAAERDRRTGEDAGVRRDVDGEPRPGLQRGAHRRGLAGRVGNLAAGSGVTGIDRCPQRGAGHAQLVGKGLDAGGAARAGQHQQGGGPSLEGPEPPANAFAQGGAGKGPVQDQPRAPAMPLADGVAQRGAIGFLVADARALTVDHAAACPVERRIDKAPGRHALQVPRGRTRGLAEPDAAAIAPGRAEAPVLQVLAGVARHHGAVEDKAAGGQHDGAGAHCHGLRMAQLELQHALAQQVGNARHGVVQALGQARQAGVALLVASRRHLPQFDADDCAVLVHDQPACRGLAHHRHFRPGFHGAAQHAVQRAAGHAGTFHAVPARRWRSVLRVRGHGFVAGVVEVIRLRRVRRLARRHGGGKAHAHVFEPGQHVAAALAEGLQRGLADDAAGLLAQVIRHCLRCIGVARGGLPGRAAAGIHHPAAFRAGAAAFEALGDDHARAAPCRFQRRAGTRGAEAHYHGIAGGLPRMRVRVIEPQRRADRRDGFGMHAGASGVQAEHSARSGAEVV